MNRIALKLVHWAWYAVHHGTYNLRRQRRLGSSSWLLLRVLALSTFVKNKLGLLESELDGSAAWQRATAVKIAELQLKAARLVSENNDHKKTI